VAIVYVTFVLTRPLRNRLRSNCTLKQFKAIDCTFPETLPGKLKARPVQQPATPALIPGNKIIDMLMRSCTFSILLIQRNKKKETNRTQTNTNHHLFHEVFSKSRLPNFEHQQEQQISRSRRQDLHHEMLVNNRHKVVSTCGKNILIP
jgi:hypothetical protein